MLYVGIVAAVVSIGVVVFVSRRLSNSHVLARTGFVERLHAVLTQQPTLVAPAAAHVEIHEP